jgi:hypothetical protein
MRSAHPPIIRLALASLLLPVAFTSAAEWKVTVRAGDHERSGSVVTFAAPKDFGTVGTLRADDGQTLPVQVDAAGRAFFVEPQLAKGAAKTYLLKTGEPAPASLVAEKSGGVLNFAVGGQPLFGYQMPPGAVPEGTAPIFAHGAHLHPIFSPSGRLVTGNHPVDHPWHRGIWMAWTKTEFGNAHPDFWNQGKGDAKDKSGDKLLAEVSFASLEKSWAGPVQAGFISRHRFLDHSEATAREVLSEIWEVTAYRLTVASKPLNVIDLVSTQTCASQLPLKLPMYHYGGLGVRGNLAWNPEDAVTMLTSNGDDRKKGDATKGKWVQLGGQVDGQPAGMVVLIHPGNFRFPQPLRLNPKNPQICIAPSQDGDWEITPGKPYVSRYRIVAVDGAPDAMLYDRLWADYAEPASAEVSAK